MEPLATPEQLAAWMGVDPEELPESAELALRAASKIVRSQARQNFVRSTSTVTLWPDKTGRVDVPLRPLVSVDSVTRNGAPAQWIQRRDMIHVSGCAPVSVTATYGHSEVPDDVLAVVLTAAQRVLSNPGDLRQETVGSMSFTYAAETIGASLSPADKDVLRTYRGGSPVVRMEP